MLQTIYAIKMENSWCGPEITQARNKTIEFLIQKYKNGQNIDADLAPVTNLQPYLDQAWQTLVSRYNHPTLQTQVKEKIQHILSSIEVNPVPPTVASPATSFPLDINYTQNFLKILKIMDLAIWENETLKWLDISQNQEKREFIFNGPFKVFLQQCYAPHRKLMEIYFSDIFPPLVTKWINADLDSMIQEFSIKTRIEKSVHYFKHLILPLLNEKIMAQMVQKDYSPTFVRNWVEKILVIWTSLIIPVIHKAPLENLERELSQIPLQKAIDAHKMV